MKQPSGHVSCGYTGREAKVVTLFEWLLTSLAKNRSTIQKQFCLGEVKQPLAKFTTG